MTQETQNLQEKIKQQKASEHAPEASSVGFGFAMAMMTDMVCCFLVGLGLGLLIQNMFNSASWVVACFSILGGIAGLISVFQMGLRGDKG